MNAYHDCFLECSQRQQLHLPTCAVSKRAQASGGKSVADGYGNLGFFWIGATAFTRLGRRHHGGFAVALGFPDGFRGGPQDYFTRLFRGYSCGNERDDDAADLFWEHRYGDSRRAVQSRLGLVGDSSGGRDPGLGLGKMALSRVELILILGLSALVLRALPQLFLVGKSFPETWDRLLRYLSYALLCG